MKVRCKQNDNCYEVAGEKITNLTTGREIPNHSVMGRRLLRFVKGDSKLEHRFAKV